MKYCLEMQFIRQYNASLRHICHHDTHIKNCTGSIFLHGVYKILLECLQNSNYTYEYPNYHFKWQCSSQFLVGHAVQIKEVLESQASIIKMLS